MLEPYGAGNNRPLFCLMGATLERLQSVGQNRHLKLRLSKGSSQFDGIFFSVSPDTCPVAAGSRVDAAFICRSTNFGATARYSCKWWTSARPSPSVHGRMSACTCWSAVCGATGSCPRRRSTCALPQPVRAAVAGAGAHRPPEGLTACYLPLLRELSARLEGADPFLRTAFCLEVFRERQLLTLRQEGDTISITLTGQGKHVRLRNPVTYRACMRSCSPNGEAITMTDTQHTTAPASLVPEIRPEVWADLEQRYRKLEDTVRHYNPSANFQQIRAAFEFAAKAHGAQMRKDGSPFITHPLAVAQIVAEELHLDS